ncbi:hypothetical protein BJ875DRAFT_456366 [Amylocarpus encephaloides]|uniref:Uncharacterized protein n=1 Tax=Amylocarpus encephaloides TaxID=45428 RepID=A0A9P8C7M9_9HELO|nr:hypothetical protein BJ875DRAFT_456366 [Amylocarpus encephaloides]
MMVKFSWPLRAPNTRQQPSRSTSTSAVCKLKVLARKAGSVNSLVTHIETAEDPGLSDGGSSISTNSGNSLSGLFNLTKPGKVLLRTQSCNIESLSRREESLETLQQEDQAPSSILLPEFPATFAVDLAADDNEVEDLTFIDSPLNTARNPRAAFQVATDYEVDDLSPNTPLEFARFGLKSTESFNTSVLPLIQPTPDSPIGGMVAAPMRRNHLGLGTRAIRGSSEVFEPPRIELSNPKDSVSGCTDGKRIVLSSHSNFKELFYDSSTTASISLPQSPKTPAMVTAPQTPRRKISRQGENSDLSFDGPSADDEDDSGLEDDKGPIGGLEQGPDPCYPTVHFAKAMTMTRIWAHDGLVPETPSIGVPFTGLPTNLEPPAMTEVPNPTETLLFAKSVPIPSAALVMPNLPLDVTGIQSTSPTPGKKSKVKRRGGKPVRKIRKALLRKPILNLVVGRQLTPPCKELLRLAASSDPFEIPDTISNVSPVPDVPA